MRENPDGNVGYCSKRAGAKGKKELAAKPTNRVRRGPNDLHRGGIALLKSGSLKLRKRRRPKGKRYQRTEVRQASMKGFLCLRFFVAQSRLVLKGPACKALRTSVAKGILQREGGGIR